jgi:hypothetical protein
MSGQTMLLAYGAQDALITGQPEISYFRSNFRRSTHFAQQVERQVIQGRVTANGMTTVRFERKGDLLSYIYLTPIVGSGTPQANTSITDWTTVIDKVELLVGGQVIDEQDSVWTTKIAPKLMASNLSRSRLAGLSGANTFYPLRFFNCESYQHCIPLVALSYHDVELRITWGALAGGSKWECYANYITLDTAEREMFAANEINLVIPTVQKSIASNAKIHELSGFNHPIKFLAAAPTASGASSVNVLTATNRIKMQMNGVDISDYKLSRPNFTLVPLFYHTSNADLNSDEDDLMLIPFCLDTSKTQVTGTVNFSRLDSARLVNETSTSNDTIYAQSVNCLTISQGMGALKWAN